MFSEGSIPFLRPSAMRVRVQPPRLYKITPSMLTFLWDECRRCFWLHAKGLHRPQMPFPSVFTRYHEALSRYCLGRCPSELDAALPPGRFLGGELWVKSKPLLLPGHTCRLYIRGRLDHLAQFNDGSWGVVDFKTAAPRSAYSAKYARQLHAYAWALEQPAPDGLHRAPISRLGLFCLDPVKVDTQGRGVDIRATLQPHYIDIVRDDAAFEDFLTEVLRLLTQPAPPLSSSGCSCCRYWQRRIHLEKSYRAHV
jgi:hypothetical protein